MLYISDSNTDQSRPIPSGVEWIKDTTIVAQLGSVAMVLGLQEASQYPAWQKFAKEGTADEETLKAMIKECDDDSYLKVMCLEGLKVAVAPIFVSED
jgi:hypothetical protein